MRALPFVVIDLETGGLHPARNPILQIGAVDLRSRERREYFAEVRAFPGAQIQPEALAVNGIAYERCFDSALPDETAVLCDFLRWLGGEDFMLANINPTFDRDFLKNACIRGSAHRDERLYLPARRTIDLHALIVARMLKQRRMVPVPACGLQSDALYLELGMEPEAKPHHALAGARHAAAAFQILLA